MTDNDVIKALECCGKSDECDGANCPYYNVPYSDKKTCEGMVMYDALDLINRQQAEIERLKSYENLYEDLKAENLETIKAIKYCRAGAVKEFAKKLKIHYDNYDDYDNIYAHHIRDDIDFLVEEMTEERK